MFLPENVRVLETLCSDTYRPVGWVRANEAAGQCVKYGVCKHTHPPETCPSTFSRSCGSVFANSVFVVTIKQNHYE